MWYQIFLLKGKRAPLLLFLLPLETCDMCFIYGLSFISLSEWPWKSPKQFTSALSFLVWQTFFNDTNPKHNLVLSTNQILHFAPNSYQLLHLSFDEWTSDHNCEIWQGKRHSFRFLSHSLTLNSCWHFPGSLNQLTLALCSNGPANKWYSQAYCGRSSIYRTFVTGILPPVLLTLIQMFLLPQAAYRYNLTEILFWESLKKSCNWGLWQLNSTTLSLFLVESFLCFHLAWI